MAESSEAVALTADIVSAFVSNNKIPSEELASVIQHVYRALDDAANGTKLPETTPLTPAVSVKKSITPDYLISLEDGQKYKSLKRHLSTRGMTPDEYRTKWGLPRDYPMVAANYSAQRSQLAKALGLGQGGRGAAPPPAPNAEAAPQASAEPAAPASSPAPRRGRKKVVESD